MSRVAQESLYSKGGSQQLCSYYLYFMLVHIIFLLFY